MNPGDGTNNKYTNEILATTLDGNHNYFVQQIDLFDGVVLFFEVLVVDAASSSST